MSDGKFTGKVSVIEDTKTYGQNGFRKRMVVIEQDSGRFPNFVPFDFIQDSCDEVDQMSIGAEVEISFRLSGRKWQRDPNSEVKYFLNAEATSFKIISGGNSGSSDSQVSPGSDDVPYGEVFSSDEDPPF
ncbi:MAG: DUF3127 domain-containing protein [Fuerstiella sp.]